MDDILSDPGAFAAQSNGDGELPQDTGGDLGNLQTNFSPSLDNLLPAANTPTIPNSMDDPLSNDSEYTGLPSDGGINTGGLGNFDFGSALNGVLGAFVTNPQNEQTQAAALQSRTAAQIQALEAQGGITAALQSNVFQYILLGLGIFLIFGFLDRKG